MGHATRPIFFFFFGSKLSVRQPQVQISPVFFERSFEHTLSQSIELDKGFPNLSRSHSESQWLASYGHFTVGAYVGVTTAAGASVLVWWCGHGADDVLIWPMP